MFLGVPEARPRVPARLRAIPRPGDANEAVREHVRQERMGNLDVYRLCKSSASAFANLKVVPGFTCPCESMNLAGGTSGPEY